MGKFIKIIAGLLVLGVVLVIAAAVILPMIINPNDFKPQIVEAVKQQTGRDLHIEGDLSLSVFPNVGLALGKTELSNAAGFGDAPFARMNAVNIEVALMPLLDKQVEMDDIIVDGLTLNLKKDKAGNTNWDDLAGGQADQKPAAKDADASGLKSLRIGGIRIENANINWQDEQQGQAISIHDFNLNSGPLISGKPVDITLNTRLKASHPAISAGIEMAGTVLANKAGNQFTIKPLTFNVQAQGKALPGGEVDLVMDVTALQVDLESQTLSIDGLNMKALGLVLSGDLKGQSIVAAPAFSGQVAVVPFNARDLMKALDQDVPDTADSSALTNVKADFTLVATPEQIHLNALKMHLDDTQLTGRFAITDLASQAMTFDLNVDAINLDRYLPPASDSATGNTDAELFPLQTLRQLNMNGVMRIGEVIKMNAKATDIVVKLKAKGGHVNMKPSAALYDGTYNADVTVDARQKTPRLKVSSKLAGVQIEPLLVDMQGEAKLAGRTDATVNITATGNSQDAVKKTLNGNATFAFTNGALVGVNIAKLLREGYARVQGQSVAAMDEPEKTDFSELKGTAKITNGVINNQDFAMKSPLLRIGGAGRVNLVEENLDYLVKASVVGSLQGQGGEDLTRLQGLTIPVRVSGPFSDPSYTPDLSAALSDSVKQKAKARVEEKKEEVKDKIKDKLKDKLKGLF